MKSRLIHTLYLVPAIFLLLIWIVAGTSVIAQYHPWEVVAAAMLSAFVAAWCVTLFAHAIRQENS